LVRSSYKAAEFYLAGMLRQRKAIAGASSSTTGASTAGSSTITPTPESA
jgi:hypothetical protein